MPAIAHAYRRGATYTWRRRIPRSLCRFCKGDALIVSLGTCDPRRARFLAGQLTAYSDELFHRAMADADPEIVMTRRQLDGVFRESLLVHLDKLDRVAAAERADPDFDPDDSRRCDRRMGWVFRLLAGRGAAAKVDAGTAAKMAEQGLSPEDIAEVVATLAAMITQGAHRMPRQRLETLLTHQNAPPTSVNLALAQTETLRAMAAAAFATERRYDGDRVEDSAKLDAIMLREVDARAAAIVEPARSAPSPLLPQTPPPEPHRTYEMADSTPDGPSVVRSAPPPITGPAHYPIVVLGEAMIAARGRDENWDAKTQNQARQIYTLFAKLLLERGLVVVEDLRQRHFADLVGTEIRADILGHGGKGETDERYCDPIALRSTLDDLIKIPTVTAHLEAKPIQLLGWVSEKKPSPYTRRAKSNVRASRVDARAKERLPKPPSNRR
jgi:hypothetical protein